MGITTQQNVQARVSSNVPDLALTGTQSQQFISLETQQQQLPSEASRDFLICNSTLGLPYKGWEKYRYKKELGYLSHTNEPFCHFAVHTGVCVLQLLHCTQYVASFFTQSTLCFVPLSAPNLRLTVMFIFLFSVTPRS